jgi:hypothetical protein
MKAVIANDQNDLSLLKLRLIAEGANDRTLMLLLELQYPMVHRLPDYLEVPIACPNGGELTQEPVLPLCFGAFGEVDRDLVTVTIRSDPWAHSSLMGARLWILQQPQGYLVPSPQQDWKVQDWKVLSMAVNGRSVQLDTPCDVHPGAIVELIVKRTLFGVPWQAFEAFLSRTEAEAEAYRTKRAANR